MNDEPKPTGWDQGRFTITRRQNKHGFFYWTITNNKEQHRIEFQAQCDYLKPCHNEAEIKARWTWQTVPIEKRRRVLA
jgi:hypothetical protein